jgi:hypothetical protein
VNNKIRQPLNFHHCVQSFGFRGSGVMSAK